LRPNVHGAAPFRKQTAAKGTQGNHGNTFFEEEKGGTEKEKEPCRGARKKTAKKSRRKILVFTVAEKKVKKMGGDEEPLRKSKVTDLTSGAEVSEEPTKRGGQQGTLFQKRGLAPLSEGTRGHQHRPQR